MKTNLFKKIDNKELQKINAINNACLRVANIEIKQMLKKAGVTNV